MSSGISPILKKALPTKYPHFAFSPVVKNGIEKVVIIIVRIMMLIEFYILMKVQQKRY